MEEWSRHFNCILNKGREDSTVTNQETTAQEPAAWVPFTANEVRNIIDATKRKKAAGPDKIYNEYLKDTAQLLVPTWTKLYNKCLEVATIPEQWRQSIIKVLYKGKGDPKDTNKYRGIALENNPFKVFTKLITERIRLTIE